MIFGIAWFVLRTSRSAYGEGVDESAFSNINEAIREADEAKPVDQTGPMPPARLGTVRPCNLLGASR